MAIVARTARRLPAALLAVIVVAVVVGCEVQPSRSPGASASPGLAASPGTAPSPSSIAVASPAACDGVDLPAAGPTTPGDAWDARTFYEIFVRSFSDSNGDGIGDLPGLTAKLDYLNDGDPATTDDLGVTGIWLMPVAESISYHGYDVTEYTAIERDYGDQSTFRQLVAAAHERGIAVIVDFVINHTSRDHHWFQDALAGGEHRDWYIWSDTNPGWPAIAGPNPWHETADGDYYYGAFWEGMPDLNLRNPEVTAELQRIAGVWLDDLGVDGFRIDAAKHLIETDGAHQANTQETLDWLADFTAAIHASHPDALVLGEVFDIATLAGRYVPESLDLTFDFGLSGGFRQALQQGRAAPLRTALSETLTAWPAGRQAPFLTNHDQDRIMSQLNGDMEAATLAAGMLLTSPGVPFLYYGEEIGMTGRKPDERIRTPMPWTAETPGAGFSTATPWQPLADDPETANVQLQAADPGSLLSVYRDAIHFRAASPALTEGATFVVDGGAEPVIGWIRATVSERLLIVVNVGTQPVIEYGLTLNEGPLCGVTSAELVGRLGTGSELMPGEPIQITAGGGLDAAKPLGALDPRSGYVFELTGP